MGKPKITLYVDIISPFAYIAYWLTRNSPAFSSIEITYVPILLGGLMQQTGNQPPINIKNKDKWIALERVRWAKIFQVPIADQSPEPFPQSTVNTQRALTYLSLKHQSRLPEAIDALYKAFWIERQTIGKPDVIQAALAPVLGETLTKEVLEGIKSDEVKKALMANTGKSFEDGAFGLPWFAAENSQGKKEGFWGVDHIGQLLEFLGVEARGERGFRSLL